MTNGTVLMPTGTMFLEYFLHIFFFFSTRGGGTSNGLACTFGSGGGGGGVSRNQPHLPPIDLFTFLTFYKYNIKPPYKRLASEKEI